MDKYDEGWEAYENLVNREDNPYELNSLDYIDWEEGYDDAEES